jgi:hypothetical protein
MIFKNQEHWYSCAKYIFRPFEMFLFMASNQVQHIVESDGRFWHGLQRHALHVWLGCLQRAGQQLEEPTSI